MSYIPSVLQWYYPLLFLILLGCSGSTERDQPTGDRPEETTETTQSTDREDGMRYIIFYGNSLTAGYGLEESKSFPSLIQQRIDSLGLSYKVVNAGLSGETTSGGKNRIDWVLRQPVDIFVLELGGNDVLRGLELSSTRSNLAAIIESVKEKNPDVRIIIAGMQAPPNMGSRYVAEFNGIYPALAEKYNAKLIPFLLEGVGGVDSLNLDDRIHPNEKGQKIVMENVWSVLGPMLKGK